MQQRASHLQVTEMQTNQKPVVLITGAAGFIGSHVARKLAPDFRVIGLDVEKPATDWPGEACLECDLTDDDSVDSVLTSIQREYGGHITSVIHLAAYYDFSGEPSPMYERLTVDGSRRMMEGLRRFDKVEQFIFSSSLLVMAPVDKDGDRLTESSPTRAEWAYPKSKLRAEEELAMHAGEIPLVILRISGVYDDECHSLPLSHHIQRINEKEMESYLFPGDITHGEPYLHIDDLADCFARTIQKRAALDSVEVFLIAEPEVATHEHLQQKLGMLIHGREWPTMRIPKAAAKAGAKAKEIVSGNDPFIKPWMIDIADDHYPVSIERAQRRLGWTPQHRLMQTLPQMIKLLKRDPQRFYEINHLQAPETVGS